MIFFLFENKEIYYNGICFFFLGMTEVGGLATIQTPNHKHGSCGTVARNCQIKIVDPESGKVLGANQSGEIWIRSITMMNGYYNNPEATNDTVDKDGKKIFFFFITLLVI